MACPEASQWMAACLEELEGLESMSTWVLTDPPPRCNILPVKWVFKVKRHQDGSLERFKARLCVKGFRQKQGIDYQDVFAPVASANGFRALMATVALQRLHVRQVDFKQAFLNGTLEDDVYIQQPEGFQDGTPRVLKLKKSLYGLKQAPRAWHETLKAALIQLGYTQSKADPGLFLKDDSWLLLYVDDQLLIGPDEAILEGVITLLAVRFQLTDMGNATFYLGVDMDISPGRVALSQKRYIKDLLQKFPSPKPARQVLTPGVIRREDTSPLLQSCDVFPRIIGALLYLAVWTRPDISNATQKLSRVLACPTQDDLDAAYRILHYLSSTQDLEIVYTAAALPLYTSYCDADYASDALCVPKRRSTSGTVVFLGGGPIIWASRTQHSVALSTCEAEYMAAGVAAREVLWLRHLLPELHFDLNGPSEIQCDNESCLALIKDPICNSKSKHIDILHHFVREHVLQKTLIFKFVPGTENVADIFTKPLEWPVFQTHRRKLLQSPV
jgi:hypothetical protein